MDNQSYNIRVPKRWVRIALIVAATALVVAPLTAVATHMGFTDVPDTNTHHNDIAWLKDADVTKGCNPPANDNYCPNDFVTRAQMATFMRNLATNQVVDAGALEGVSVDELVAAAIGGGYAWSATDSNVSTTSGSFVALPGSSVVFAQSGDNRGVAVSFTAEVATGTGNNIELRAVIPGVGTSPTVFLGRGDGFLQTRPAEFIFQSVPPGDHEVTIEWRRLGSGTVFARTRSTIVRHSLDNSMGTAALSETASSARETDSVESSSD